MASNEIVVTSEAFEDDDGLPHPYTSEHSFATSTTNKTTNDYDNGHAWCVAFVGFLTQMLIFGSVLTFGVYFVAYQEAFPEYQPRVILWIGSLAYGIMFLTGPFSSMVISRIGTFHAMLLSATLVTLGYVTSYFAQDPYHLFITFGLFVGMAFSLAFLSCYAVLNDYFTTRLLRVAQIIITVGGGVGIFIFNAVFQFLINEYGWRGSMLINAGLYSHFFVFALVMKPRPRDVSVKRMTLGQIMAVHVLFNRKFQLFLVHVVIWNVGFMIVFSLLNSFIVEKGLTADEAALIGMVGGILNAIGRVAAVPLERVLDPKKAYVGTTVAMGLFEVLILAGGSFFGYAIPLAIANFAFGIMICYLVPVIGELVGFDNITPALGYSNFSQGIAGLLSPVLLALIEGGAKFAVGGGLTVLSGLLVALSIWMLMKERARRQDTKVLNPANGPVEFKSDQDGGHLLNSSTSKTNTAII
ncbi:hypothetical protein RvY_03216 [Ramazzottius varieornatus]|uniref:Major facilitator superfamily (MFS) profile domain-containing protein n=1 Tax=Ramazzottius varieornatus TaxID=947166 RepID=A0A1D1UMA2_RAMVA|nr:hypothetical protein RvY_03216 [Ramazzottius varieornatus]